MTYHHEIARSVGTGDPSISIVNVAYEKPSIVAGDATFYASRPSETKP